MLCIPPPHTEPPVEITRAALLKPRKWRVRVVEVRFLDGDPVVWGRIARLMTGPEGWNSACGLQFIFNQSPEARIRVSFAPGSSWSYEGDYDPGAGRPTMNFGWLDADTDPAELRRVALHEFGHALGLVHEHSVPWANIPWDRDAVYAYYLRTNGWLPHQVEAQVMAPVAREVLSSGGWDGKSIMQYSIPAALVRDHKARGGNGSLSAEDRRMVARWYGPPPLQYGG